MSVFGETGRFNPKGIREFLVVGNSSATSAPFAWQPFQIPKNAGMVFLFAAAAGGGGGGGKAGAATTARGGGGGGGGGSSMSLLIPARFLPRTIYLSAYSGGLRGAAGAAGGSGYSSLVQDIPGSSSYILNTGPTTGGSPGTTTGGAAGAGDSSKSYPLDFGDSLPYAAVGIYNLFNGPASGVGGVGGSGTGPTNGTVGNSSAWAWNTTGGGGGGASTTGVAANGGGMTSLGFIPTLAGGLGSNASNGANGGAGISLGNSYPFVSTGGMGGGANGSGATGGTGGAGGIASGGGGGGAGVTAGPGGPGGPGFIYVCWW